MKKYTQETFIEKCHLIHGNKYDYSKTIFSGIKNKIIVICPKHGEFTLTADKHINSKRGCPFCSRNLYTQESFIEACKLVHGNKYDYSKTIFNGVRNPITVICPKHGEFVQRAGKHLYEKQNCPKCAYRKNPKFFAEEIKEIYGEEIILLSEYQSVFEPVKIQCTKCKHISERKPVDLLSGYSCYYCNSPVLERKVENWLNQNNIAFVREKTFSDLKAQSSLRYDFYLPDKNILIECQGKQHFEWCKTFQPTYHDFLNQKHRDWLKRKYARDNKIKLLYVNYWDFSNWKNDRIEQILKENIYESRR